MEMGKCSPVVIVHGGAWSIPDEMAREIAEGVKEAAKMAYRVLSEGGSALDAVTAAITALEDNPVFDAGFGSVLNEAGEVEMDAIVMCGKTLKAGAIASVTNVRNPIQLARKVMEKTEHVLLSGRGAEAFAAKCGVEQVRAECLVTEAAYREWRDFKKYRLAVDTLFTNRHCDTVGAVALDCQGEMACGTSTGGITAKMVGRVGDAPIIGCGAYCDDEVGGVSCTGHGESIMKVCLANHIIQLLRNGQDVRSSVADALSKMQRRVSGQGGAIAISAKGEVGLHFTTERMAWAYAQDGLLHSGLNPEQRTEEKIE